MQVALSKYKQNVLSFASKQRIRNLSQHASRLLSKQYTLRYISQRQSWLSSHNPPWKSSLRGIFICKESSYGTSQGSFNTNSQIFSSLRMYSSSNSNEDDDESDTEGSSHKEYPHRKGWRKKKRKESPPVRNDNGEGNDYSHVEDQIQRDARNRKSKRKGRADDSDSEDEVVVAHEKQQKSNGESLLGPPVVPKSVTEALILPLHDRPILPNTIRILEVDDEKVINKLMHLIRIRQPFVGTFLRRNRTEEIVDTVNSITEVEPIGTFVSITDSRVLSNGRCHLFVQGHYPIKITGHKSWNGTSNFQSKEDPGDESTNTGSTAIEFSSENINDENIKENASSCDSEEQLTDGGEVVHGTNQYGETEQTRKTTDEQVILQATRSMDDSPMLRVCVETLTMHKFDPQNLRIKALAAEVVTSLRDIVSANSMLRDSVLAAMENRLRLDDFNQLCNLAVAATSADAAEIQQILAELDMETKLMLTLETLKRELLNIKLQNEIRQQVENKVNEQRRKHLLYEQLHAIKKELGITKDETASLIEKFRSSLEGLTIPPQANDVIEEELQKLSNLDSQSSEFQVTRSYLEWLTSIPWGKTSTEVFDVKGGLDILNKEHYGMDDVKDRILEFIAVSKLKGRSHGKILSLVGPPGVGKTSIAKSIAKALNREYYRFSVGGMNDVAEIKGHRRTYVGAIPGDPSSALLELLDPEQNSGFLDHYLDVPVDFSNVLFVCTANVMDTIPTPLKDRMEIIELSGYLLHEKINIATDYLIPQAREATGISAEQLTMPAETLAELIRGYCRESGVRSLRKQIEKIHRKVALKIVRNPDIDLPVVISPNDLREYISLPLFTKERMYDVTPPGVVMGLAWTALGGSILYFETIAVGSNLKDADKSSSGSLRLTGSLGDVMKESANIAHTYAKYFIEKRDPTNTFLSTADISLHVPEGATPKDGPSAGCTMVTALVSLALKKNVRQDFAMTGELSLTGKILKVGGIKEKLLAARREGVTSVVLPDGNRSDFEELPAAVKDGLEIHFAKTYDDVFRVAFEE